MNRLLETMAILKWEFAKRTDAPIELVQTFGFSQSPDILVINFVRSASVESFEYLVLVDDSLRDNIRSQFEMCRGTAGVVVFARNTTVEQTIENFLDWYFKDLPRLLK